MNNDSGAGHVHRVMEIEDALRWVYGDELPKIPHEGGGWGGERASMHPMWRSGAFGSRIENWNREPGMPAAMGDPDPDALVIAAAVDALDVDALDLSGTLITYQLPGNYDSHQLLEQARGQVKNWLVTCAKQKRRPDVDDTVSVEPVKSIAGSISVFRIETHEDETADGGTVTVTGECVTKAIAKDQYKTGTYCKLRYFPTAKDRALDRAIYAVYWLALQHLARDLSGTVMERNGEGRLAPRPILARLGLKGPAAPRFPWLGDALPHSPQVLASCMSPTLPDAVLERAIELGHRRPTARRPKGRPPAPVRKIPVDQYGGGSGVV